MNPVHIGPTWERKDGKFILPERTIGFDVIDWAETWLLQPDGPDAGGPWQFTKEQKRFVLWWYAIDSNGRFVYRRGMLRRMKGWGKDPLSAVLCCAEMVGPCRFEGEKAVEHYSSNVQIAAVSQDQVKRNTMGLFPSLFSKRAIREYELDIGKEIIYAHQGRGRIELLTTSARSAEGPRPTFILENETQHWIPSNGGEDMAEVCSRNAAKSRDGSTRILAISNAHNPGEDSIAERDYDAYLKIAGGQSRATGFLYDSIEAPPDVDMSDEESLRGGLKAAAGDAVWLDIDRLVEEIYDPTTARSTARRFYLNQIVATEDAWLAPHEWEACASKVTVEPGEQITLGLDGSKSDDHTALVACRVTDSHLWPLGIWDPAAFPDGELPRLAIDGAVSKAFETYDVVGFYSDVHPFESYIDKWEQELGDTLCARANERHPIQWDMRGRQLETTKVAEAFHDAVVEGDLSHPGEPVFSQYFINARRRPNNYGVNFGKESAFSSRKVDAAAAAMLARKARQDYLSLPEGKKRQAEEVAGAFFV